MTHSGAVYREDFRALLPNDESVAAGLAAVFGELAAQKRVAHVYASSFPAEIVQCTLADGRVLEVLCKYTAGKTYETGGHRGGIPYEIGVYRSVLGPLSLSTPAFYGDYTDPQTGDQWLFVEYLDAATRADDAPDPAAALRAAARWAGEFQLQFDRELPPSRRPALTTYDVAYYSQWSRRAAQFGQDRYHEFPWLDELCRRFEAILPRFAVADTVVHGEYTPHNILVDSAGVHPVDWESAAVGVGSIDVASLVEGWPDEVATSCVAEYRRVRWPSGPPQVADDEWEFARTYWSLRWLGHGRKWRETGAMRMEQLRRSGERLGLI